MKYQIKFFDGKDWLQQHSHFDTFEKAKIARQHLLDKNIEAKIVSKA